MRNIRYSKSLDGAWVKLIDNRSAFYRKLIISMQEIKIFIARYV